MEIIDLSAEEIEIILHYGFIVGFILLIGGMLVMSFGPIVYVALKISFLGMEKMSSFIAKGFNWQEKRTSSYEIPREEKKN